MPASPRLSPDLPVQNGGRRDGACLRIDAVEAVHGQRVVDRVGHLPIGALVQVISRDLPREDRVGALGTPPSLTPPPATLTAGVPFFPLTAPFATPWA